MSKLYLVPTPVGNLEDITIRALNILREVNTILAEDTRTTRKLLSKYEIGTRIESHHVFNEHSKVSGITARIKAGETIALVSDAGTPAVSDPGFLLVRECIEAKIDVECLPGPTALIPALVVSGLPADRFCFEGFLPHKKGRRTRLQKFASEERTVVLYESPHRIIKTLGELQEIMGSERRCSLSREISKLHEETIRGTLGSLLEHLLKNTPKGEMVLVIAPAEKTKSGKKGTTEIS